MLSDRMQKALCEQVNAEMYSAYYYLSMAAYFESIDLPGFAKWMQMQAQEELSHGMKFYAFVNEMGGRVTLHGIDQPPKDYESPLKVMELVLEHEIKVTGLIHGLMDIAVEERDYSTQIFLQYFVKEQVEEESTAVSIVAKLKMTLEGKNPLLYIDRELGMRGS